MKRKPGRPKGSQNKITTSARELAEELGISPLAVLLHTANKDWEALGYESPTLLKITADGAHEVDRISLEMRVAAAREACKYIYPTAKEVTVSADENCIKLIVEDYTRKS